MVLSLLNHRGIVRNDPIGALAHLDIACAFVQQGDRVKARVAAFLRPMERRRTATSPSWKKHQSEIRQVAV